MQRILLFVLGTAAYTKSIRGQLFLAALSSVVGVRCYDHHPEPKCWLLDSGWSRLQWLKLAKAWTCAL